MNLFLRPDLESINIYDCASTHAILPLLSDADESVELETDDFQKIFAFMPALSHVNLRFAGQMKDQVFEYMMDRNLKVKSLQLDAANLVSDGCWRRFFQKCGSQLETLKLSNLDFSFDDESVEEMCGSCPRLRRLKLEQCWKLSDRSLRAISTLTLLEHLSLNMVQAVEDDSLLEMVDELGPNLRTLSLEGFPAADDRLFQHIRNGCRVLTKFRFTNNAVCTDKGFAGLFQGWPNPPLERVDFSAMRDVDNADAGGPADPIGLSSEGFLALMEHSGSAIQTLNLASCRHVSHAAFEEVFSDDKTYPHLQELDVSFHTAMDDYLVGRVFRCCPAIKKLVTFACFNMQDPQVPLGVALIGGPKAQDPIIVGKELQEK